MTEKPVGDLQIVRIDWPTGPFNHQRVPMVGMTPYALEFMLPTGLPPSKLNRARIGTVYTSDGLSEQCMRRAVLSETAGDFDHPLSEGSDMRRGSVKTPRVPFSIAIPSSGYYPALTPGRMYYLNMFAYGVKLDANVSVIAQLYAP